jgi:hypothetical protein
MISTAWLLPFGLGMVCLGVLIGWRLTVHEDRKHVPQGSNWDGSRQYVVARVWIALYEEMREQNGGLLTPSQLDEFVHRAVVEELVRIDRRKVRPIRGS